MVELQAGQVEVAWGGHVAERGLVGFGGALDPPQRPLEDPGILPEADETPIGLVPTPGALDLTGLKFDHTKIAAALRVDPTDWITELRLIDEWFATIGGNRLPDVLREELAALRQRLAAAASGYAATIDPRRDPVLRGGESRWAQPRF